jgi:very-short-patch-repair endonuclease
MESILDECKAAGLPNIPLSWHYRSRHESLIAFSNDRYYGGGLVTFPAPVTKRSAVSWRKIDGVYAKGKDHTNPIEARALADEVIARLKRNAVDCAGESIAVVTLNAEQQALVEDLLDKGRRAHPDIEPFFDDALAEPVVVKNLETVQGDERDVVLLGIGFGPTTPNSPTMSMNFGPLNREGGWRRLNVAVTRARREMVIFTSFSSSMIDLHRTGARAVADLKHFIEFAERGPVALAAASKGSVGDHESPFESAVAEELRRLGWQVVPQIGVSRFRIDLGVVHPDKPGDFLVGVECDGAMYHSAATARDRDKIRAAILADLGWTLVRIWSTDWWFDRRSAIRKVDDEIKRLLADARAKADAEAAAQAAEAAYGAPSPTEGGVVAADTVEGAGAAEVRITKSAGGNAGNAAEGIDIKPPAITMPAGTYRRFVAADFDLPLDRHKFEETEYTPTLLALIERVLTLEAPIRDEVLVERISRLHGFHRSGDRIRERVLKLAKKNHLLRKDPYGGRFVWCNDEQALGGVVARHAVTDDDVRRIEDISSEEIRAAVAHVDGGDLPVEIARFFGIRRLSADARERVTKAIGADGLGIVMAPD